MVFHPAPGPFAPEADGRNPKPSVSRRLWLKQAGALAGASALPLWVPNGHAQTTLNALPRLALIIGNTKYVEAPLKNPANDARAIAGELQKTNFKVNLLLDAGRAQMAEAIASFSADLAKTKGVGMFYYAGHGAQLAWRNYLIPVDAVIEKLEDMRAKTIELSSLLEGMTKAKNPMNVIMLDACRDNPFGTKVPTEQKGLSQFDAPPGSLLAYATSPGNTASDGDGANGLYTENLLREIKVPEAKIEDVLKRVRLAVRRKSEGQQIPWESTSLEDDFYFLPPQHIRKLSEAELEKTFNEELAIWEKIKTSQDPEPLENYLRAYPSGKFSELAQYRLDRALAEKEAKHAEAQRLAQRAEDAKRARLAEEKRIAEEKRLAEESRLAEENRRAAERRLAEERKFAEQKRLADEQRIAKLAEEKRAAEEARLAQERKQAEERRAAEEKRLADERRLAEEKIRAAELRLAEERRIAKIEDERRAAPQAQIAEQTASLGPNPFSKGTARIDTNFKIGDSYSYREIDMYTKLELRNFRNLVTEITENEVIFNKGVLITDLFGNVAKLPNGLRYTGAQFFIHEYSVGKKWITRFRVLTLGGATNETEYEFKVVAREQHTVPAGTFDAYRVEGRGWTTLAAGGSLNLQNAYWISPGIRRPIANEIRRQHSRGKLLNNERTELTAFVQQ